jgi:hypothetical protein
MPRLSNHLPQVGALVLAAVVAAVAYSVHESQSPGSSPVADPSVSTEGIGLGGSPFTSVSKRDMSTEAEDRSAAGGPAADSPSLPTSGARSHAQSGPAESLPAASTPLPAPRRSVVPQDPGTRLPHQGGQHRNLNDRAIDRELHRLIDDQPAPRRPPRPPSRSEVSPGVLEPVADTPIDGAPAGSPPPASDPGAGADPDAGLDDTAVGGLDQTDLGEPVDETDPPTTDVPPPPTPAPAPAPAPEAPPAAPPAEAPPATPPAAAPPPASTAPA